MDPSKDSNTQNNIQEPARSTAQAATGNPLPLETRLYDQAAPGEAPHLVYITRPLEPMQPQISAEAKQRHEASRQQYPDINLSDGEYVISAVKRHPIGVLQIWLVIGVMIGLILFGMYAVSGSTLADDGKPLMPVSMIALPGVLLMALALLFGSIATGIYRANRFFLTNESVIQYIQTGIFSKRQQTVSLGNIEDASYSQQGIVPTLFNYGLIRLSTQGDETTYRFNYASRPEKQVAKLNNAVEAFKNGRPVDG